MPACGVAAIALELVSKVTTGASVADLNPPDDDGAAGVVEGGTATPCDAEAGVGTGTGTKPWGVGIMPGGQAAAVLDWARFRLLVELDDAAVGVVASTPSLSLSFSLSRSVLICEVGFFTPGARGGAKGSLVTGAGEIALVPAAADGGITKLNTSEAEACFNLTLLALPGAGAANSSAVAALLLLSLLLLLLLFFKPVRNGLFATMEFDTGRAEVGVLETPEEKGSCAEGGNSDGGCPDESKSKGEAPVMTCALPWKRTPDDFFFVSGGGAGD